MSPPHCGQLALFLGFTLISQHPLCSPGSCPCVEMRVQRLREGGGFVGEDRSFATVPGVRPTGQGGAQLILPPVVQQQLFEGGKLPATAGPIGQRPC